MQEVICLFSVNLTDYGIKAGDKCVLAVMTDNSNDKNYPPGKPQYTLDFAYHGGIYRDVWLIGKSDEHNRCAQKPIKWLAGSVCAF